MKVRLFISDWRADPNYNSNPVVDWIDANISGPDWNEQSFTQAVWPDFDPTGRPNMVFVGTVVYAPTTAIEGADAEANIDMMPPYNADTPVSSITNPVRNQIRAKFVNHGYPVGARDPFTEPTPAGVWRDVCVNSILLTNPVDVGIVTFLQGLPAEEFA